MILLTTARFPEDTGTLRALLSRYVEFLVSRVEPEDRDALRSKYDPAAIETLVRLCETANAPPNGTILIARRDKVVLGCGMLRVFGPNQIELQRIYVTPDARGMGLGRRITEALMDVGREVGATTAFLDTGAKFHEAIGLYQSLGFRECPPYHDQTPEMAHMLRYFRAEL